MVGSSVFTSPVRYRGSSWICEKLTKKNVLLGLLFNSVIITLHDLCFLICFRLLAAKYRPHGVYKDARSIIVIHNLAHQVHSSSQY